MKHIALNQRQLQVLGILAQGPMLKRSLYNASPYKVVGDKHWSSRFTKALDGLIRRGLIETKDGKTYSLIIP